MTMHDYASLALVALVLAINVAGAAFSLHRGYDRWKTQVKERLSGRADSPFGLSSPAPAGSLSFSGFFAQASKLSDRDLSFGSFLMRLIKSILGRG